MAIALAPPLPTGSPWPLGAHRKRNFGVQLSSAHFVSHRLASCCDSLWFSCLNGCRGTQGNFWAQQGPKTANGTENNSFSALSRHFTQNAQRQIACAVDADTSSPFWAPSSRLAPLSGRFHAQKEPLGNKSAIPEECTPSSEANLIFGPRQRRLATTPRQQCNTFPVVAHLNRNPDA